MASSGFYLLMDFNSVSDHELAKTRTRPIFSHLDLTLDLNFAFLTLRWRDKPYMYVTLNFAFYRFGGSLRFLFWDLFGMSELSELSTEKNFVITQYTGEILLGLYSILSILVAINMLIAMMANSYQRVAVS